MNKKLLQFASMLLVAVCLCMNFTACSDDDDDEKEGNGGGSNGKENSYAYVDLGLPSGLKWATCNVGAENPWDYGAYFAWGEITPKSAYHWSTYLDGRITKEEDCGTDRDLLRGITDIKGTQYDAARANMGENWRMPTVEEQRELIENCYWEWTDSYDGKGVSGYIVYKVKSASDKGKMNTATVGSYSLSDAHIFLPAAGYRYGSDLGNGANGANGGVYWSSSLNTDDPYDAYRLYFFWDVYCDCNYDNRIFGQSVRGVCK